MAVTLTNYSDKTLATLGDKITYKIIIKSTEDVPLKNTLFKVTLSTFMTFWNGSLYINGENKVNENPVDGVSLSDIPEHGTVTIFYKAYVGFHNVEYIENQPALTYDITRAGEPTVTETAQGNLIQTPLAYSY